MADVLPVAPTIKAIPAQGTKLNYNTGTPTVPVWTTVTERVSIDPPDGKIEDKETSGLDSKAKEFLPGLPESGDLGMQVWYVPTDPTHQFLWGLFIAPRALLWQLVFADGTTTPSDFVFGGYLNGFKPGGIEPGGYLTADIKIKVTGLPTFNPGS